MRAQFVTSAVEARQFPPPVAPEVAFLGRSNVGKSSLLNSLLRSRLAYVSSSPGRTRTINFFSVSWSPREYAADLMLVDLPGYGYAKVSKSVSAHWAGLIEPYLLRRPRLALSVLLVDSNIEPQSSDRKLLDFLRSARRRAVIVATKADRISKNQLNRSLGELEAALAAERILPYSAKTHAGREELWREIRHACAQVRTTRT